MTNSAAGSQTRTFAVGALAILLVVTAALAGIQYARSSSGPESAEAPKGIIPGAGAIPAWLAMANPSIITEYTWAAEHHNELQYIPCYCGCGMQGHESNSSCYFQRDGRGQIKAYDQYAVG